VAEAHEGITAQAFEKTAQRFPIPPAPRARRPLHQAGLPPMRESWLRCWGQLSSRSVSAQRAARTPGSRTWAAP